MCDVNGNLWWAMFVIGFENRKGNRYDRALKHEGYAIVKLLLILLFITHNT